VVWNCVTNYLTILQKINIRYLQMPPFSLLKTRRRLVLLLCFGNFLSFHTACRDAVSSPERSFVEDAKV